MALRPFTTKPRNPKAELAGCGAVGARDVPGKAAPKSSGKNEKRKPMKKYLFLAILGVSACDTPAEKSAREQIDAACLAGKFEACVAVQERRAAEDLSLATMLQVH